MPVTAKQLEEAQRLIAQKLAAVPKLRIVKREEPWVPNCPKCMDKVTVRPGPHCDCEAGQSSTRLWIEFKAANQEAADRRAEKARQKLERAGGFVVPERYKGYTPTTLASVYGKAAYKRKEMAVKVALAWAKGTLEKPSLLVTGDPGTGKTALMLWAFRHRIARTNEPALLIRYMRFINAVQATYSGEGNKVELLLAASTAALLLIDEFGENASANGASSDKQNIMREVLDARNMNDLPTVIITNLTNARLMAQFGGDIISRLQEMALL